MNGIDPTFWVAITSLVIASMGGLYFVEPDSESGWALTAAAAVIVGLSFGVVAVIVGFLVGVGVVPA